MRGKAWWHDDSTAPKARPHNLFGIRVGELAGQLRRSRPRGEGISNSIFPSEPAAWMPVTYLLQLSTIWQDLRPRNSTL